MKKLLLIFILISSFSIKSFSQVGELIGAGVLDFLLSNPKTVNNMSVSQKIGAELVRDLLNKQSDRRYYLKYAEASADKITINTTDGRQAQFIRDTNNNVYILLDGIIYPIAKEFVEQSRNIDNYSSNYSNNNSNSIPPNNLEELRNSFEMASINNLVIRNIFTFKWCKDFDGDGYLTFDEFKKVKNAFYNNENFRIVVNIDLIEDQNAELILEIIDDYTGELIFSNITKLADLDLNQNLIYYYVSAGDLPCGTYLLISKLEDCSTKKGIYSLMDKIQIIPGDSSTQEIPFFRENKKFDLVARSQKIKFKLVKIGRQIWMSENLNSESENSWCFENKIENCSNYGRLYNWEEAKNICPNGWHLPSIDEWNELEITVGLLKPNRKDWRGNHGTTLKVGGNSGFDALIGGRRIDKGKYVGLKEDYGFYWSSSDYNKIDAWFIGFRNCEDRVQKGLMDKKIGMSVRCLKD